MSDFITNKVKVNQFTLEKGACIVTITDWSNFEGKDIIIMKESNVLLSASLRHEYIGMLVAALSMSKV